jgi:hypothetical protein
MDISSDSSKEVWWNDMWFDDTASWVDDYKWKLWQWPWQGSINRLIDWSIDRLIDWSIVRSPQTPNISVDLKTLWDCWITSTWIDNAAMWQIHCASIYFVTNSIMSSGANKRPKVSGPIWKLEYWSTATLIGFALLAFGNKRFSSGPMIRLLQINCHDLHCRVICDWRGKLERFHSQGLRMADVTTDDFTITETIWWINWWILSYKSICSPLNATDVEQ